MEGKIFYAKMDECVILKKLIETTKDIVSYLTFNISVIGIDVTTMDSSHVALVKFHLDPITFQEYMCSVDSITVTVDIRDIARTFKFHNPHDTVMLAISNTIGGLEVTFMKSDTDVFEDFVYFIENNEEQLGVPESYYTSSITMSSHMFNDLCKQFSQNDEAIEIETGNYPEPYYIFMAYTKKLPRRTIRNDNNGNTILEVKEPVKASFALRYLNLFTSTISDTVSLKLRQGLPLMVEYILNNNCGYLWFYLAPKMEDN